MEEHHPETGQLFANFLSREANAANHIKKDMPIMVAIGNPPYSGHSSNIDSWIAKEKIEDYKYIDGVHFDERRHWLNNDYVQFIRLGEHYVEKNGEGILAYITDHSYLDNPTFRGMRWHLLNTFDTIHIIDLHGSSLKGETPPQGIVDKNVFDIQQGVSIIIASKIKANRNSEDTQKPLATVYHYDLWGSRPNKHQVLLENNLASLKFQKLDIRSPSYFFVPKSYNNIDEYNSYFSVTDLFETLGLGYQTSRDPLVVGFTQNEINKKIEYFSDLSNSDEDIRKAFFPKKKDKKYKAGDSRQWNLTNSRIEISKDESWKKSVIASLYRPFDVRYILYDKKMVDWPRPEVLGHMLQPNISLIVNRQSKEDFGVFCSNLITERKIAAVYDASSTLPLYRYESSALGFQEKCPNLNKKIMEKIENVIGKVSPEQIFDYIYALLHSPTYRDRYAEFLKSEFPRIPFPSDRAIFDNLVTKGNELRSIHLMENPILDKLITKYPISGNHLVDKWRWEGTDLQGKVWLNATQYFENVPKSAWELYVGGYQPAQKWLKDRKGGMLLADDIRHYQRMIIALAETDRMMKEINEIDFLPKD